MPIDSKREEQESVRSKSEALWDSQLESASPADRRAPLEALRERLLERNYINNCWPQSSAKWPKAQSLKPRTLSPTPRAKRRESTAMGKVVGIDLGTTNSLVAYVRDGEPRVMRDSSGDALVPSIVSLADEGTIYVGREAQRRLLTAPSRPLYSVNRSWDAGRGRPGKPRWSFRVGGD